MPEKKINFVDIPKADIDAYSFISALAILVENHTLTPEQVVALTEKADEISTSLLGDGWADISSPSDPAITILKVTPDAQEA